MLTRPRAILRVLPSWVMIWPLKGFLSSFLVLLVTSPLSCESGLCEGRGSSKLRYLVCEQSWECAIMASDEVVPESLFLLHGELCIGSVGISCGPKQNS